MPRPKPTPKRKNAKAAAPRAKRRRRAPTPPPRRRWRAPVLLAFVLPALLVAASAWLYLRPGPLPQPTAIVVPRAAGAALAESLAQAGLIDSPPAFRLAHRLTGALGQGPLHAAEFAFPAHASLRVVLSILRHAHPVEHKLTIPEGLTARAIAHLLDAAEPLAGPESLPPEGAVLPQTYNYLRGTQRAALIARAEQAMSATLAAAWSTRAPGLILTTPAQALILASIVERETALPAERPHIAAVFLNRLRLEMKLQSDPTVVYAITAGAPLARPLSRADLEADSPYNTYRAPGLPPGPICAPGLASIEAVLHPTASADLYFVADGTGGHAFAATLADHNRNVARWRALH